MYMVKHHTPHSKQKISTGLRAAYETGLRIKKSPMQGRKHSVETLAKMRASALKRIQDRPDTIPDHTGRIKAEAGYMALHAWAKKYFGQKTECKFCGSIKNLDWSNKDGKYTRNPNDWQVLCHSCHMKYDRANGIHIPERLRIK